MIDLQGFSVTYPGFRLEPMSVQIHAGERVALVGPNGSGKSTTMRAMAGRLQTYDGVVRWQGTDIRHAGPEVRASIGVLPETVAVYPELTVREHFRLASHFYPTWDDAYLGALCESLGLDVGKKAGDMSKGTRVKFAFVLAEAYRPPLLLLDEPTSGLDPGARGELLTAVRRAVGGASERAVIFSTHILEDIDAIADRVLVLQRGRLILDAPLHEIRANQGARSIAAVLYEMLGAA